MKSDPFTVSCPSCGTEYPVDPGKVPVEGVHAICSTCLRVFAVRRPTTNGSAGPAPIEVAEGARAERVAAVEAETPAFEDLSSLASEALAELEAEAEPAREAVLEADPEAVLEAPEADRETKPEDAPDLETEPSKEPAPFEDLSSLASEALAGPDEPTEEAAGGAVIGALSLGASRFGARDPHDRARRLARVLVSDIIAYYPSRYRDSQSRGTLRADFEQEVAKSWKEYVDQVGSELADSTPFFTEALNEILAKGEDIF